MGFSPWAFDRSLLRRKVARLDFLYFLKKFAFVWLVLVAVMLAVNTFFVWREANRAGRPFISSGMRLAIRAFAPCLLVPAATTIWFLRQGYLGDSRDSPRDLLDRLLRPGFAFHLVLRAAFALHSGLGLSSHALCSFPPALIFLDDLPSHLLPNFFMGLTFGVYHLVYAVCTWPRRSSPGAAATTAFE